MTVVSTDLTHLLLIPLDPPESSDIVPVEETLLPIFPLSHRPGRSQTTQQQLPPQPHSYLFNHRYQLNQSSNQKHKCPKKSIPLFFPHQKMTDFFTKELNLAEPPTSPLISTINLSQYNLNARILGESIKI